MFRGKRIKTKRLKFKNSYRTKDANRKLKRVFSGPMRREGITSLERIEQARMMKRLGEMGNAGLLKKMHENGQMPNINGVQLSDEIGEQMILPDGVRPMGNVVQNPYQRKDIARQLQRYNSGVYTLEEMKMEKLKRIAQAKKLAEAKQALIKWMAETDELDEVPVEYLEEVKEYYDTHAGSREKAENARRERKEKQEKYERVRRLSEGYWNESPFTNIGMPPAVEAETYGNGVIKQKGEEEFGWSAPKLHTLLKPVHPIREDVPPEKIIEDRDKALDERREEYKEQQMFQRGQQPPKNMVERAMPKLASPIFIEQKSVPFYGIIPHDFIFPQKKYNFVISNV